MMDHFRSEIGRNAKYRGFKLIGLVLKQHWNSFSFVCEESHLDVFIAVLRLIHRDSDVLPLKLGNFMTNENWLNSWVLFSSFIHPLGFVSSQFYLQSEHYVPDRMLKKIDRATGSMMENGLHEFYTSLASFKMKLILRIYSMVEHEDFRALSVEQLKRPLILLFCLSAAAMIIFIAEIIISKWKSGNQRPIRTRRSRSPHISHTA